MVKVILITMMIWQGKTLQKPDRDLCQLVLQHPLEDSPHFSIKVLLPELHTEVRLGTPSL